MEKSLKNLEEAKLSYLRNAGNILEISQEMGLPVDKVKELVEEFKKQENTEVSELIANTLMRQILHGSASRKLHLMEMLKSLDLEEKPLLSICCTFSADIIDEKKGIYKCLKCNKEGLALEVPDSEIYDIKLGIVEALQNEDALLVELAEKMGYTKKVEGPSTVIQQKNNILVMGSEKSPREQQLIQDVIQLSPMDREILVEKLQKEIINLSEQIANTYPPESETSSSTDPL